jgi:hypothetical protein
LLDEAAASSEESGHSLALIHALGWCAVVHAAIGKPTVPVSCWTTPRRCSGRPV